MIKKFTVLLMSLLMLCSFATAETVDYAGMWYLGSIESNGIVLNPADIGMAMTFSLNEDGTGMITITDEEDTAVTWTWDGETLTITSNDEPLVFIPTDDGKLIAEREGTKMTFGRDAHDPSFVPASELAATDIAAFDGTWNITMVNANGMLLPFSTMAQMGMADGTLLIHNGSVTSFGAGEAEAGTLTNGKLIVPSPTGEALGKSISLLEDGTISVEYMEMIFYCEQIVALAEQTVVSDQEYTITSKGDSSWQFQIPKGTFDSEASLLLQPIQADTAEIDSEGVSLVGPVIEIKLADREAVRLNQPVRITMQIPPDQIPTAENVDNFFVGYWKGTEWEYIFPDLSELYKGMVSFDTYHFSMFAAAELTDEEKVKLYAKKMAVQTWEDEENEKAMTEKLQSAFDEAFTQMGIEDNTVKGELFRYASKETDFGTLLVSAQDGDLTKFTGRCGKLAANALIEKFYSDRGFVKNLGGMAGAAGTGMAKAALQLSDGKYADAAKELSTAFINYFPAGRAYTATVDVINASISSWKNYEMESAYQAYTGLAQKGVYGFTVDPGDWVALVSQMEPYLRQLQTEAKDRYCKVNGITQAELDADSTLSQRIADQTEANLKQQFEKRINNEDAIKAREEDYRTLIEGFERDGLLDRDKFRFGSRDDIQDRLRSLFKIRANILDMVGGNMPNEMGEDPEMNMNTAITEWIVRGTEDRAGFYEWMKEKGYLKAQETDISGLYDISGTLSGGFNGKIYTEPMLIQQWQIEQTNTVMRIIFLDAKGYVLTGTYDPATKTFIGKDTTTVLKDPFWDTTPWQASETTITFTIDGQNVTGVGTCGDSGALNSSLSYSNVFNFTITKVSNYAD